jgi:hypothetical protein
LSITRRFSIAHSQISANGRRRWIDGGRALTNDCPQTELTYFKYFKVLFVHRLLNEKI